MEYQKLINLLDNTLNQPSKFKTKNCAEVNDDLRGTYSTDSQIDFNISMKRSSLCDYSHAYILVKETITVPKTEKTAARNNKEESNN